MCGLQNLKLKADKRAEQQQMAHDRRQTYQQKVCQSHCSWLYIIARFVNICASKEDVVSWSDTCVLQQ